MTVSNKNNSNFKTLRYATTVALFGLSLMGLTGCATNREAIEIRATCESSEISELEALLIKDIPNQCKEKKTPVTRHSNNESKK